MKQKSNIEFKARCDNPDRLKKLVRSVGAEFIAVIRQRDTYFNVRTGRYKLRQTSDGNAELIKYARSDAAGPKCSRYTVKPVRFAALRRILLSMRFGTMAEVIKMRELWLWKGVRIHLDSVDGLGAFLELEAVVEAIGSQEAAQRRCRELMKLLEIRSSDLIAVSYADLI